LHIQALMPEVTGQQHGDEPPDCLNFGKNETIGNGCDVEGLRKNGEVFPLSLSAGKAVLADKPAFLFVLHNMTRPVA